MIWEIKTDVTLLVCAVFTVLFVASCYMLPRSIRELEYGTTKQVIARMVSTTVVSIFIVCSLLLFPYSDEISSSSNVQNPGFLAWIGFRKEGLALAFLVSPLLVFLFFFGNIVLHILEWKTASPPICRIRITPISSYDSFSSSELVTNHIGNRSVDVELEQEYDLVHRNGEKLSSSSKSWEGNTEVVECGFWTATTARDYFIAPLTEELVFRSAMIPLLLSSGLNRVATILLSPVFFSLSHIHLSYSDIKQGISIRDIVIHYSLQLVYTYIFGAFVTFIFIRTGQFISVLIIHSFCNLNGLPRMNVLDNNSPLLVQYRIMVSLSYIVGFIAFGYALMPLTEPKLYSNNLFNLEISSHKELNYTGTREKCALLVSL